MGELNGIWSELKVQAPDPFLVSHIGGFQIHLNSYIKIAITDFIFMLHKLSFSVHFCKYAYIKVHIYLTDRCHNVYTCVCKCIYIYIYV